MKKFDLIVAVCENFGIGLNGDLPWRLKSELKYFNYKTKKTRSNKKCNAVIMGRRTYFGIPNCNRPLSDRLNIVLSQTIKQNDLAEGVLLFENLETAMKRLEEDDLREKIENVWVIGGRGVYKDALASHRFNRLYLTKIMTDFVCDTFFPRIPFEIVEVESDIDTPLGIQEENNIQFEFKIYEKKTE